VTTDGARERTWDAGRPVDLPRTVGALARGAGDPAHHFDSTGAFWWAVSTPLGDGTLRTRARQGVVEAHAWGPGADWLLDQVPRLLGVDDDWTGLDLASLPHLRDLLRSYPGMRLPASGRVLDSLVPAILEQRVTGNEARRSWRQLLYRYGTPAPGPQPTMRLAPTPQTLLAIPTWDWHRFGVDGSRQRAIRAAATVAHRLEEIVELSLEDGMRRLQFVPGIGVWTAAETMQRALGHPDAVSVGDFHIANVVVHHLTGKARGTDEEMLELLEPWRGHRQRVVRLIEMSPAAGPPKFGPRYSPLNTRAI
jgi:3-methyladenine DNA glycosylase/8-oxoguanine DNA glycosylase